MSFQWRHLTASGWPGPTATACQPGQFGKLTAAGPPRHRTFGNPELAGFQG